MKRLVKILLTSALASFFLVPMTASAAPSHRCTVNSNQLFYFMISVDDAIDEMQQDLIEHYGRDNSLKRALQSLVKANRALHDNVGRQAIKDNSVPYSYSTLDILGNAAQDYYNLAASRMRNQQNHLQNAYELHWLIQEAKNEFDSQCRDNRKQKDEWYYQWDERPDYASVVNMMNQAMAEETVNAMAMQEAMMHQMMAGYHGRPNIQAQPHPVAPPRPRPVVLQPMDDASFNMLKQQLKDAPFDDEKQAIITAAAPHHHFTVTQLRDLMAAESFDSAKLIYAEAIFPRLVDKSNWFILLKVMTFDSYKQKLQEIANRSI